jgi:serine/threonine-protein kinase
MPATSASPDPAFAGPYELLRELGRGGMATVYLARDPRHDRDVAVKVMRPDLGLSAGADRFLREIRLTAALHHPHIVGLYDSGGEGEHLYFVMPHVDGESLRVRLRREVQLPIADALRIAIEVADALHHAHERGILHRDVKPENILLAGYRPGSDSWHAMVADFGVARALNDVASITSTGVSVGTPLYMSPEQAAGDARIDRRVDVYALGCVLYEMLVGEPPFTGPTTTAVMARHLTAAVPSIRTVRPSVPNEIDDLVQRALAKVPADRVLDARAFGIEAQRILDGVAVGQPTTADSVPRRRARQRRMAIAIGIVTVAIVGYVAFARDALVRRTPSVRQAPASDPRVLDPLRIAVVPFRTLGDAIDPYLADALTDELISALARSERLRVLSRSSVQSLPDGQRSPQGIGRAVLAGSIVEGTIHRKGDSLEFTVALIDAKTGEQPWSKHYARSVSDALGVSDSAASAIAERLGDRADTSARATTPVTASSAAYDAYLRGRFVQHRDGSGVQSAAREDSAVRWFERALELDPRFALAYTAIADTYGTRFFNYDPNPVWHERAFVAIEKALALDPNLAEAYQEKGDLLWTLANGFPHEAAAKLHRRAAKLKPSLVDPHQSLGSLYMHVGLLDRAMAEYDTALALDPGTTFVPPRIARVHWYQGDYARALAEYDAIPLFTSAAAERALVLNYLGRGAEALVMLDTAARAGRGGRQGDFDAARAVIYATRGEKASALEAIARALRVGQEASHFHHAAYSIAQAYALLGDADKALEFLRRTAAGGMPCYPLFRDDPHLRSLARDPRFVQFMKETQQRWEELAKKLA